MNIAICEDEIEQQIVMEKLLKNVKLKEELHIFKFSSGENLTEAYKKYMRFSIIILDMKMSGMDGIKTAQKVREYDANCIIIIITSILEYAIEGYGVNAFDFLLKPVKEDKFYSILSRALEQLDNKNSRLYVIEYRDRKIVLKLSDILYIESRGRKINIICSDNTFTKNNSISIEEQELYNKGFIRISRYYLVNLQHIKEIHIESILLNNQCQLNISPKLREIVFDRFTEYMMEMT